MEGSTTHQILYSADHWSFSASIYYKTGVPYDFKRSQTKSQQWSPNLHISPFLPVRSQLVISPVTLLIS